MKLEVLAKPLADVAADALVVLHDTNGMAVVPENAELRSHVESFARALEKKTTTREWFCTVAKNSGVKAVHLLLDSATFGDWSPGNESLKTAAARAVSLCRAYSLGKVAFALPAKGAAAYASAVLEGAWIGDFQDTRFKSGATKRKPLELVFVADAKSLAEVREALRRAQPILEGVTLARELVNAPNNVLTPKELTGTLARVARQHRCKAEVLDAAKLKRLGYNLLYNVGRGSEFPPAMATMHYAPKGKPKVAAHIVLVGKGMTFDTGGLCIKTKESIYKMNNDMGGAAAVIGAMHAIAALKLPVKVTAIVPSAHNAVDGAAYHPGAIIKAKNGKTVYIENTDAEGRLILADAFAHAESLKPDVMIDFATLTGACVIALGPRLAGLFTDDAELRDTLLTAGERTGDCLWPLPLWKEYDATMVHALADLNNMSREKSGGGATHGANFLKAFVPKGVRWAHLDIAGTAVTESKYRYYNPGGTGFGVRLIVQAVQQLIDRG